MIPWYAAFHLVCPCPVLTYSKNWTTARKIINFVPCLAITGVIFSQYSIVTVFWQLWIIDLKCSFEQLNNSQAIGLTGTAVGCMIFIPLAIKYGRRPIYIASMLVMLGMAIWNARMNSITELYIISLITGLAGATNETIVQMTVRLFAAPFDAANMSNRSPTCSSFTKEQPRMDVTWAWLQLE